MTTICSLAVIAASLLVAQFIPFSTAEVCDLSPDPGPCKASIEHYYYNQKTGDCETFIYGGCGGNGNNFATKEKCEDVCKTVCEESPDSGPCKGQIKNYYYNHKTGNCETFIYGGCGGNENNFDTKEKCEAVCKTVPVCEQPQDPGSCKAYVKHYYYDQETETCKDFIYGGCQGNGNNFETKGECESTCISVCHQPPKTGPCRAHVKRYYYDQMEKTCKQFIYGGCDGNENNFKTKEECERTCQSVCELPPDRGPCRGHMLRYYYDQNAKTCKEFIYGGCQGNGNNFLTKKECERTCKSGKGTSPMWDYFWMLSLDDEHMFS